MKSEKLTKEALRASWGLLEKGQTMADAGKSIQEILKILPDSTLIQTNTEAILFFIEGSVPMLIELPGDPNAPITKGGSPAMTSAVSSNTLTSLALPFLAEEDEGVNVVAKEKGEEEREEKKILLLSPYSEDFGSYDDVLAAHNHLNKNKNYESRITYKNANITLEDFQDFNEYDLVHLSTHGLRFCSAPVFLDNSIVDYLQDPPGNPCRTLLKSGVPHGEEFDTTEEMLEILSQDIVYKDLIIYGWTNIYLKSSFFEHFYAGGVQDKIWIFSACELGQNNDLLNAMKLIHKDGHFFYWLNEVSAYDAFKAFDKFYKNLEEEGLDAKRAFEKTPDELRSNLASFINDTIPATTSLLHLNTGQPRHGIEIIEMYHPEEEDQKIRSGDFYPLVGDFGDGEDEALTLKLELKGYTREEFEEKSMSVGLKVDDEIVMWNKPFFPDLPDDGIEVEDLEDQEYGVEVIIADIPIPDVGDKERITLKAFLHFDQERFSIHKEEVVIKADGIEAIVHGGGKTVRLTYDDKRRTMKIQTSGGQGPMYMDEDGYLTRNAGSQGWVKINMKGFMGMVGQMPSGLLSTDIPIQEMLEPSNKNFFFPMVEWGIRFRMSAFERNPNFKKQEEDCGKPEPCQRFNGIAGQEQGVRALFEPNGRLKEINFQGNKVIYKYGLFNVVVPEARELSIGL
ncbi:MAG: hypothetical protein KJN76_12585 [Eudoraea sp.]|nr:hypothetical protein [Eudoraea sp.]